MKHLLDREILDLLVRTERGRGETHAHLAACSQCRRRLEEFREIWLWLGRRDAQENCLDRQRPMPLTEAERPRRRPSVVPEYGQRRFVMLAGTAVAVAALAGFMGGRFSRDPPLSTVQSPLPATTVNEVALAMHLDAFGAEAVGLSVALPLFDQSQEDVL